MSKFECQYKVAHEGRGLKLRDCGKPAAECWIGPNRGKRVFLCIEHAEFVEDAYRRGEDVE